MPSIEVHRDSWDATLNAFTRVHDGWLVSVELVSDAGTRTAIHHLPLAGVSVDRLHGETAIVISAARSSSDHVTHVIAAARRVFLRKTDDGADAALEIESRDGDRTVVKLRVAARPETVDGMVAAVNTSAIFCGPG
jgi:hypothetical protein